MWEVGRRDVGGRKERCGRWGGLRRDLGGRKEIFGRVGRRD